MKLNKSISYLLIISVASLILKLYTVDFSIPVNSDNLIYALNAISYKNGDFSQLPDRSSGWSLFLYPFFYLIHSDNFLVYSNLTRLLSLGLSTISIPFVYLLGRKFFNEKYSIIAACLFAFEPHLNYNSGLGLSEPLYHLAIIMMFYFILNKNSINVIPSMFMAGVVWWSRINGLLMVLVISIVYFFTFRKNKNLLRNYGLGILLLLLVISPVLIQRYMQFGDPLYYLYSNSIFAGNLEKTLSVNDRDVNPSMLSYIHTNGVSSFIETFIIHGAYNILSTLARISIPYFIILIPLGIIFSFKNIQNNKYLNSLWIFVIVSLGVSVITFSIVNERRFLFYIYPFFAIVGTLTIQKISEHKLNILSNSDMSKNIFLIGFVILIIILSGLFTVTQYGKPDLILEQEKLEFDKFLINNLHGGLLDDSGIALDYVKYLQITNSSAGFRNYKITTDASAKDRSLHTIRLYAESMDELVSIGRSYNLKYVISNENRSFLHPYVDDIYNHEKDYPYLHKIFDSSENGLKKLKVKVFEINYEQFHK